MATSTDRIYHGDGDEAFCEGDVPIEDLDPDELADLDRALKSGEQFPEGSDERNLTNLAVLTDMYGDDLRVI